MYDFVSLAAFVAYTILFILVIVLYARLIFKSRKLVSEVRQLSVEKLALLIRLEGMAEKDDSVNVENTDGFLRFISESRDWAFEYIENVQSALNEYDEALHTDDAKIINEAYKKLIDFLPQDDVVS